MVRYRQLAAALDPPEHILARWAERVERSAVALSGPARARDSYPAIASLVEELARALPGPTDVASAAAEDGFVDLAPGSRATRELEKAAAFVGAAQAGRGGNGFDLAAAILALRELACEAEPDAHQELRALFEWLLIVALNAFASGSAAAIVEKHAAYLEQKTPVVMVTPVLPALFLLDAPDRLVLDRIFSRLLLAVVRVGARAAIIDASGLRDPGSAALLESLAGFATHRKIAGRLELHVLGLDHGHEQAWRQVCSDARISLEHHELFAQAVARALHILGYEVQSRPAT